MLWAILLIVAQLLGGIYAIGAVVYFCLLIRDGFGTAIKMALIWPFFLLLMTLSDMD